jgi:hypothetical protein
MRIIPPSVFIIGAAKAATTSIAQNLSLHDEVYIPPEKELAFFNNYEPNNTNVALYEQKFYTDKSAYISIDASPQYSFGATYPFCPSRIRRYCPHAKLVYLVRDPVVRMQSHMLQLRNCGKVFKEPLGEVIAKYPQVLDASLYGSRLKNYLKEFDTSQMLVLQFEKLISDPESCFAVLQDFLGVRRQCGRTLAAKNATTNHYEDRSIMRVLRSMGLGSVGGWLPTVFKRRLINLFKRSQDDVPSISSEEASVLEEVFREDCACLFQDWKLEPELWTFKAQATRERTKESTYEGSQPSSLS